MPREPLIPESLTVPDDEPSAPAARTDAVDIAPRPTPPPSAAPATPAAPAAPAPAHGPDLGPLPTAYGIPPPRAGAPATTTQAPEVPAVSLYAIAAPAPVDDARAVPAEDDGEAPTWRPRPAPQRLRHALWAAAAVALFGAALSAVSTADFVQHLDRQVHSIHCSVIPGAGQSFADSGCKAALMSPYSSLLRTSLWGGLPIALLALAVFAYLVYRAVDFALRDRVTRRETLFLVAATGLPVGMSAIYGFLSATRVGALCDVCLGMYLASAGALIAALVAHRLAPAAPVDGAGQRPFVRWFGEGVLFVAVLAGLHLLAAPTSERSLRGCGTLVKKDDPARVLIDLGGGAGAVPSVTVLDPLCAACGGFDARLAQSGLRDRLDLRVVLMPLDASCNWMVKQTVHPGACAMSEAILCEPARARELLDHAFTRREALQALARQDERALREHLLATFPHLKGCLGTPAVKSRLNKNLRWAVANALPVLTPQLFVGDTRVCDEDTDLGLEYTVATMLARHATGGGRP